MSEYLVRSGGSRYRPSRWMTVSCKLQRLWKLGKSSLVSRHTPSKGPAHGDELEVNEKSIDTRYSHSNASSLPRETGGWFSRYKAHSVRNGCDRPNYSSRKQGMAATGVRDGCSESNCCVDLEVGPAGDGMTSASSRADNHPVSFKRFLMKCTGTATAGILHPLKLVSVPCFPPCMSRSVGRR